MPEEITAAYRILDASLNRASEGLRTLEELARFGLDHRVIAGDLKALRHELTSVSQQMPRIPILESRDTEGDVGTSIGEPTEYQRDDLATVLGAAAARVQQSLRVIEECCKVIEPKLSPQIEQIRYRSYTVTASLEMNWHRRDRSKRLAEAHLYALVDAAASTNDFEEVVLRLCRGGVDVLQLRDRHVDDRTLIERGRRGTELARQHNALFIMNDRADLAVAADCDGVHVGQEELPAKVARRIVGSDRLIGVSTHSLSQARDAVIDGADYIGCGPVFPGSTKQFDEYAGTKLLIEVAKEITLPAFAIGGIEPANLDQVIAAGFDRVAVTGALRDAKDPASTARDLKAKLERAPKTEDDAR